MALCISSYWKAFQSNASAWLLPEAVPLAAEIEVYWTSTGVEITPCWQEAIYKRIHPHVTQANCRINNKILSPPSKKPT